MTVVVFHHALTNSQPDSRSAVHMLWVQALEDGKDLVLKLWLEADAVIFKRNMVIGLVRVEFRYILHFGIAQFRARDLDHRIGGGELDRIAQHIVKQLADL